MIVDLRMVKLSKLATVTFKLKLGSYLPNAYFSVEP